MEDIEADELAASFQDLLDVVWDSNLGVKGLYTFERKEFRHALWATSISFIHEVVNRTSLILIVIDPSFCLLLMRDYAVQLTLRNGIYTPG